MSGFADHFDLEELLGTRTNIQPVREQAVATSQADTLLAMIGRATQALENAKTSAEVLDARDMASAAYHAAKSASRLVRAKEAHDTVLAQVYKVQGDALMIESKAKIRLAEEYDAAQGRGEVASNGQRQKAVPDENSFAITADLGLNSP